MWVKSALDHKVALEISVREVFRNFNGMKVTSWLTHKHEVAASSRPSTEVNIYYAAEVEGSEGSSKFRLT